MSFKDEFEDTGERWEESGSNIWVYKCKKCGEEVNSYARSTHSWFHRYKEGKIK